MNILVNNRISVIVMSSSSKNSDIGYSTLTLLMFVADGLGNVLMMLISSFLWY